MLNSRARQVFHADPYNAAHLLALLYCQLGSWARERPESEGRFPNPTRRELRSNGSPMTDWFKSAAVNLCLLLWAGFRRHHTINSVIDHQLAVVFTRVFDHAVGEFG